MCTAAGYKTKDFYFGRTLDYDFSYGEEVILTPRRYPFRFRHTAAPESRYAILGMAHAAEGTPLYYDAVNEKGLCMAGLNFVGNAYYPDPAPEGVDVAQFEFIPWILSRCATVKEARERLRGVRIVNTPFSETLPTAQLHWLIADRNGCVTVESVREGLFVYENPVGVLTNNPTFPEQLFNLNNFMRLSTREPVNTFSEALPLRCYGRGMGALGLPGDWSSMSRFVRAAFVKLNARSGPSEEESVSQFFHILGSVEQPRGCNETEEGRYEITVYTSCMNAGKGIYYYNTYNNHRITAVDMRREKLDGETLVRYPLVSGEQIWRQNGGD